MKDKTRNRYSRRNLIVVARKLSNNMKACYAHGRSRDLGIVATKYNRTVRELSHV